MEHLVGFEPTLIDLQSTALANLAIGAYKDNISVFEDISYLILLGVELDGYS